MANNYTRTLRFPGGLAKALTLSYDDAVVEDIRLIEIMKQHGLKGTFNINSSQYIPVGYEYPTPGYGHRMEKDFVTKLYTEAGMEAGIHAYTHPHLEALPAAQIAYEIVRDRATLEEQFGTIVRGGAYPYGTYNDTVLQVLKDCGIAYCRTVVSTEKFDLPTDWLRLPATCHHKNPRLMELAEKFITAEPQPNEDAYLFYLWGHSYEFARDDNWHVIEDFAARIGGHDDIWYATNIEICEYVEAYNSLRFSMDMKLAHNPTSTDVWFMRGRKLFHVPAGKTVVLD